MRQCMCTVLLCCALQELYGEAFALELLLQQTFLTIPDVDARREMSEHIRCGAVVF